ncbi:MAG: tetratricopeptide repeat protein [Candidatus Nealsonbacteria bacterium]|nr:tetratricopeptide repeat protein [Candidatus Nealsonbacteria bacterium]
MSPETTDKPTDELSAAKSGGLLAAPMRVIRAAPDWAKANRLKAALIAVACLASVGGFVVTVLLLIPSDSDEELATLERALDALDAGYNFEARDLADRLLKQDTLKVEELGGPPFVLGAVAAAEADEMWPSTDRDRKYLAAARYLEEARDRGFPPGRRAEGLYLLGKCLYVSGQIPAARPNLLAALKINKRRKTEIHGLLGSAYLNDANPQLDKALTENGHYLEDRGLSPQQRHEALAQRAQILFRLGETAECVTVLDKIPLDASNRAEATVIRGRILMQEARALRANPDATTDELQRARQKLLQAVKVLRYSQGQDTLDTQATGKAMYLIGVCQMDLGNQDRAALAQFSRTSKLFPDAPEGLASGFHEAELSRQLGQDAAALAAYRRVLSAITEPENFSNPWITLDQLRARVTAAHQHYLRTRNFEISVQLTRFMYPLFSKVRTQELTVESYNAWGEALVERAASLPQKEAEAMRQEGRARFRRAARIYTQLARLQIATRHYHERLWDGAMAYYRGHDYRNAVLIFEKYLADETQPQHPQALVHLGSSRLALGDLDKAIQPLGDCIDLYPRDATAYQARLVAAEVYLEKGKPKKAEALLKEILNGEGIDPEAHEWRSALFALGKLLHAEHRHEEAVRRLEEAVERYGEDPQSLHARFLIADCYRQDAEQAREQLENDPAPTGREQRLAKIEASLKKAADEYRAVRLALIERQGRAKLTAAEAAILRNAYFAIGDLAFQLGSYDPTQYEEAIKEYLKITSLYQSEPVVLVAYEQMDRAYHRLNQPSESRAALEQAKVVLSQLRNDAPFEETTNYSQQQWGLRLDWLIGLRGDVVQNNPGP